jgi:hypothetical protein
MGGVLTHFLVGTVLAITIYLYFKFLDKQEFYFEKHLFKIDKSKGLKKIYHKIIYHKVFLYSLSIFVGHMIVDFFKFFIPAVYQGTWKIFQIDFDKTFWFWADLTNNFLNWLVLGFCLFLIINYLYKKHIINKRSFFEFDYVVIFFLIGVAIHLIVDYFVLESNAWI